jgi:hypothetical protein
MKKSGILAFVIGAVLLSACGPTKTNPTKGYNTANVLVGSDTQRDIEYRYIDKEIPVTKEVPVEITKEVIVTKEVPVEVPVYINKEVEQNFAQAQIFQISSPSNIKFVEGENSSFEFNVRILQGKVKFDADVTGLPAGAIVDLIESKVNSAKYKLSWAPKLGSIPADQLEVEDTITVSLKNLTYVSDSKEENSATEKVLSAVKKTKDISFVVRRTAKNPTLKVVGLDGDRNVGEEKRFTVEVYAPGTYVGNEPELEVTYDMNNIVTSKGAEMNGAFYVRPDDQTTYRVKIAEETWKFSFVYDTKNYPIQASFDKNMKAIVNPDKLLVRTSFQAITPFRTTSDKKMLQFAIKLTANEDGTTVNNADAKPVTNTTRTFKALPFNDGNKQ